VRNGIGCTQQSSTHRQALTATMAHPRKDTSGALSEGSRPSKTAAHGQDLMRPLVCQTKGGCSPMRSILLTPAGQPRGHPKGRQTRKDSMCWQRPNTAGNEPQTRPPHREKSFLPFRMGNIKIKSKILFSFSGFSHFSQRKVSSFLLHLENGIILSKVLVASNLQSERLLGELHRHLLAPYRWFSSHSK
jgi:hypothetical protein